MAEINERALTEAQMAVCIASGCGLTIDGKRAFCDDPRAEPEIRHEGCDCKAAGRAAILAYESALPAPASVCAGEREKAAFNAGVEACRERLLDYSEDPGTDNPRAALRIASLALGVVSLAAPPASTGVEDLRDTLRRFDCPRPCNNRPDDFTVGQCVDAMECGCLRAEEQTALRHPLPGRSER